MIDFPHCGFVEEKVGVLASKRKGLRVLKKRSDFLNTFKSGRKIRPADFLVFNFAVNSTEGDFRCGWTLPRAVGVAVTRNKLKRWTKDWLDHVLRSGSPPPPVDLNIGFRSMPEDFFRKLKRADFDQAMDRGWKRLIEVTRV